MQQIIVSAVIAVVSGFLGAGFMLLLERRRRCFDVEYLEGAVDGARGRYIRRDASLAYKRGYGHACHHHRHHLAGKK